LIKPTCVFVILATFISGTLAREGLRAGIKNRRTWLFSLAALLPSLMFYGYGFLTRGYVRFQAAGSFRLHLLVEPSYWLGWLHMINTAVGVVTLGIGLFGILLLRRGLARSLACGLWAGYFMFGLVFNYHIYTHSYYQLQLIPIVAFSLAAGAAGIMRVIELLTGPRVRARVALAGILMSVCAVMMAIWIWANWESIYYEDRDQVTIAEQIGDLTAHTAKAVFLSYANGELLQYHGELVGVPWPWRSEMHAQQGWARPNLTPPERFREIDARYPSDYFIVTEVGEYKAQPELGEFLVRHFPLLIHNARYLVFDLRSKAAQFP